MSETPLLAALRRPNRETPYARGVADLLTLLGLLREGPPAGPSGEVAGMVLASLAAHLRDGVTAGLSWDDLDAAGLRGVDILRALEASRLARVAAPTPARVARTVQAVIKARRGGEDVYLMQYDAHAGRYQPIGGKVEASDDGPEAALRREMWEELGLKELPTAQTCPLALILGDWGKTEISATYGILTRYAFDFLYVEAVAFPLVTDEATRWLSRAEIAAAWAADGRAISPIYAEGPGLARLDGLPPTRGAA